MNKKNFLLFNYIESTDTPKKSKVYWYMLNSWIKNCDALLVDNELQSHRTDLAYLNDDKMH